MGWNWSVKYGGLARDGDERDTLAEADGLGGDGARRQDWKNWGEGDGDNGLVREGDERYTLAEADGLGGDGVRR
jgi:hypothetical protein